ncbi:MAG: cold shock domain-containing protein [Anaerolineae bacterium]|nr:cold shock domain-containing protein [Anaerolineae bacterium]
MRFRDQQLTCQACGRTFFFTVTEQRQMADKLGEEAITPPELCSNCRGKQAPVEAKPQPPTVREPIQETRDIQDLEGLEEFPLQIEGVEIKLIGRVKWYSRDKGYGFVTTAKNQDIFFHRASLVDRYVNLREDDQVEFQIQQTAKGPEAINVSLLPDE